MESFTDHGRIFYDGDCGLCHWAVRFVVKRLPSECSFRFAPLAGPTFAQAVATSSRHDLPDSIVVLTSTNELLVRSSAALYVLGHLGLGWKLLARVGALAPRRIGDWLYDLVARNRFRFFHRQQDSCPLVPDNLRRCFDP